jgi:hypothetical protein
MKTTITTGLANRLRNAMLASLLLTLAPYFLFLYVYDLGFAKAITMTSFVVALLAIVDNTLVDTDQIRRWVHFFDSTITVAALSCFSALGFISPWFIVGVFVAAVFTAHKIQYEIAAKRIGLHIYIVFNSIILILLAGIFFTTAML